MTYSWFPDWFNVQFLVRIAQFDNLSRGFLPKIVSFDALKSRKTLVGIQRLTWYFTRAPAFVFANLCPTPVSVRIGGISRRFCTCARRETSHAVLRRFERRRAKWVEENNKLKVSLRLHAAKKLAKQHSDM